MFRNKNKNNFIFSKLILFTIILFVKICYPQNLPFITYSTEDGLAQSRIEAIFQDSKGYIWFGTENGPSIFDGINFRNLADKNPDLSNLVRAFTQDKKGNMWIGTRRNGLFKYDGVKVVSFPKDTLGLASNRIEALCLYNNDILIGTSDQGLLIYKNNKFQKFEFAQGNNLKFISSLLVDKNNNLWITSRVDGIYKYDGKNAVNYYPGTFVKCAYEDASGNMWFGTSEIGLLKYNGNGFVNFKKEDGLPDNQVNSVIQDVDGYLWLGTRAGITKYDNKQFKNYTKSNGLSNDFIVICMRDFENNLWFGTYGGGVVKLPTTKFENFTDKMGFKSTVILSITEDSSGKIWFGTFRGGVSVFDGQNLKNYSLPEGLPTDVIWSIKNDSKNRLWLGTSYKGIYQFKNNRFVSCNLLPELNNKIVYTIFEDKKGNIYFGTREGGLFYFDGKKYYSGLPGDTSKTLKNNSIVSILEDSKGNLWFATLGNGVYRYSNGVYTNFSVNEGLAHNEVNSICEDKNGCIWFATTGGISKFYNNSFTNFSIYDGLNSNQTYFILSDNDFIYVGTTKGVNKIQIDIGKSSASKSITYFSLANGLAGSEMNIGAHYKDKLGNLWFGTTMGATKYIPTKDKINSFPPFIHIKNIEINDVNIINQNRNEFEYYENKVFIEFIGISFSSPNGSEYQFKMEGLDANWSRSKERSVKYYIKPGSYTFRVRAMNNDGIWSTREETFAFTIHPPFWETWWFYLIAASFLLSSFLGFYFYRINAIKKRNIKLEKMVLDKTKELRTEQEKTEKLLLNILPVQLVNELKAFGKTKPQKHKAISILFSDFVGFTSIASQLSPEILVNELNELFRSFDEIVEKLGLEKLKTIGDSYMVGSGLPISYDDHATRIVYLALEMIKFLEKRNLTSGIKWSMRIGIHSGQVVAGVVGKLKFTYDIWGDTVNVASRMESNSEPMKINVSGDTFELIKNKFLCEYRGKIEAKGKGKLDMYFVIGEINEK